MELLYCKISRCENLIKTRNIYCSKHRARLDRTGRLSLKTPKEKLLERISIDKDTNCWNYLKYKNEWGYGRLRHKNKKVLAHRLSYMLHKGKIPKNMLVCHSCDNPSCVNPEHLWIGTNSDNMKDRYAKEKMRGKNNE